MSDTRKDPDQLERQVDDARANLSQTVDALGAQLSPGQLIDQVFNMTKEQGGEFASKLGQQAKDNPLALVLTGIGMTWLMAGSGPSTDKLHQQLHKASNNTGYSGSPSPSTSTSTSYPGSASGSTSYPGSSTSSTVASRMQSGVDSGKDTLKAGADAMKSGLDSTKDTLHAGADAMRSGADAARQRAATLGSQFEQTLRDQPLVMSGLGIALGAALGAMLPASELEDRFMGETSDQAKTKAADTLSSKYDEGREKLKEKAREAEQAIKR